MLFYGLLHNDPLVLAYQQELSYTSSVRTLDVVWRTWQEGWVIETDGDSESEKSVLLVQLDDFILKQSCWKTGIKSNKFTVSVTPERISST